MRVEVYRERTRAPMNPTLVKTWRIFASVVAVFAIVAAITWGIVLSLSKEGPVVIVRKPARLLDLSVPEGGRVAFEIGIERVKSCPGVRIDTFRREMPVVIVQTTRPILSGDLIAPQMQTHEVELPDSVRPGQWTLQTSINSQCPTHPQTDVIADLTFFVEGKSRHAD